MNIIFGFLRITLLILQLRCYNAATKAQNIGTILFTDSMCSYNASNVNVSLAISNNNLDIYMYIRSPIRNVTFDMDIKVKSARFNEYKSYFKHSVDYCKFSKNPMSDPFVSIIYEGLRSGNNTKMFGKCPIMPVSLCSVIIKLY